MDIKTILLVAVGIAIVAFGGMMLLTSNILLGSDLAKILPLGPGGCVEENGCRAYCEDNLGECIKWCTENKHPLCNQIAGEFVAASGDGTQKSTLFGPGGCKDEGECIEYCSNNLGICLEYCENNESELCEVVTKTFTG